VRNGVLVVGYVADATGASRTQQAGIQVGDIITAVNGHELSSGGDLASQLLTQQPGTPVTLAVVRGTQHLSIAIKLGQRPVALAG
jgi:S1-C subfamily serine protease